MAVPSLAELRALKRAELQALCKANDIKANSKNDVLIASLTDKLGLSDAAISTTASAAAPQQGAAARELDGSRHVEVLESGSPAEPAMTSAAALRPADTGDSSSSLSATINTLRAQLASATSAIAKLEVAASADPSTLPGVQKFVDETLKASEKAWLEEASTLRKSSEERVSRLAQSLVKRDEVVETLANDVRELQSAQPSSCARCETLEASLESLRCDVLARLAMLEARPSGATGVPTSSAPNTTSAQPTRAVSFVSPSLSDAPPTESLASFTTPVGSPATPTLARDSPIVRYQSINLRKMTPFKSGAAGQDEPVSAVPGHMLAVAASAARRQRSNSIAVASAVDSGPQSPAPLVPNASLGKHVRYSDASDQSVVLAALDSPESNTRATTPFDGTDGFVTAPNTVRKPVAEMSASAKKDVHARKRMRVSSGARSTEAGADSVRSAQESSDEEEAEDGEELVYSLAHDEPEQMLNSAKPGRADVEDECDLHSDADEQVRDYLVATKTGDSPATAVKAGRRDSGPSTSDPNFFAAVASPFSSKRSSPLPSRRSFSFAPGTDQNEHTTSATGGRKSLPLAALPFPIVSPFRSNPVTAPKSARKATPGTGTKKATIKTFFGGDAANRLGTSAVHGGGSGLFTSAVSATSARKSRARAGTLSGDGYAATKAMPPATPLAPRTLFGTEGDSGMGRFAEGDGIVEEEDPAEGWKWERGAFADVGAF